MDDEELLLRFRDWIHMEVAYGDPSPQTVRTYISLVRGYLKWCKGRGLDPIDAIEEDIKLYRAQLIQAQYKRGTIRTKVAALRQFYAALVDWKMQSTNPVSSVRVRRDLTSSAEKIAEKYIADKDAFLALYTIPDPSTAIGLRDRAILRVLCFTGIRVSELCGLDLMDIKDSENPQLLIRGGKGHKRRHVPISMDDLEIVGEWLDIRRFIADRDTNAIFITMDNRTKGRRISTRGVRVVVNKYLKQAGLKQPGRSCHALRHSLATWLLDAGVPTEAISDLLGHESIATTAIYAKIVDMNKYTPSEVLEVSTS